MATQTFYPSSTALASGAGGQFTNPTNAYADDTNYATWLPTAKNANRANFYSGYDFSAIPDGSTLNSVVLEVGLSCSGTLAAYSMSAQTQASNGGTNLGSAISLSGSQLPSSITNETVDITAGVTLAQMKTAGFGAFARATQGNSTTYPTYSVDYVRFYVDWTPPPTAVGRSADGAWNLRQAAGRSADAGWDVLTSATAVGRSASAAFAVLAAVGASGSSGWNTREVAGRNAGAAYQVTAVVGREGSAAFHLRAAVGRNATAAFRLRQTAGRAGGATFSLAQLAGRDGSAAFDIAAQAGVVGRSGTSRYSLSGQIGRTAASAFGLAVAMGRSATSLFGVRAAVGRDAVSSFAVLSGAGSSAVGRSGASTWLTRVNLTPILHVATVWPRIHVAAPEAGKHVATVPIRGPRE